VWHTCRNAVVGSVLGTLQGVHRKAGGPPAAATQRPAVDLHTNHMVALACLPACLRAPVPCSYPFEIHDDALVLRKMLEHDQQLAGACVCTGGAHCPCRLALFFCTCSVIHG
jgi:hypothetical protein